MAGKKGKKKQRDLVDDAYSYVKEKKKKEDTKEEEKKKDKMENDSELLKKAFKV